MTRMFVQTLIEQTGEPATEQDAIEAPKPEEPPESNGSNDGNESGGNDGGGSGKGKPLTGDLGKWNDPNTLNGHFDSHGSDVGATDAADYAAKAKAFLEQALNEQFPDFEVQERGIDGVMIYQNSTGLLGYYDFDFGTARSIYLLTRWEWPDYLEDGGWGDKTLPRWMKPWLP